VQAREPNYARRTVLLLVDSYDLATVAALRYSRSLRPSSLRAVHFVLDSAQASRLRDRWLAAETGVPLELVDCPDRRLARATAELVTRAVGTPDTHVTVVLPRRSYSPLTGRLLHDRTAEKIARVVSRIPHAVATIIPYDVDHKVRSLHTRQHSGGGVGETTQRHGWPEPPAGVDSIAGLSVPGRAMVEGRLHATESRSIQGNRILVGRVGDSTGEMTAVFYGRAQIPGVEPGTRIRLAGKVCAGDDGLPSMINPAYELLR
jgi:hypothetical protein